MSSDATPRNWSQLFAGRWQIPLALVAATTAGIALYSLLPTPQTVDFAVVLADIAVLENAGDALAAADAAANFLEAQPPLPADQRAELHDRLADIIYRHELQGRAHHPDNVRKILDHAQAACELGRPETAARLLRRAQALQWLGEDDQALETFRAALEDDLSADERRWAVQGVVELLERRPEARLERRALLDNLLADDALSPAYTWWALQRSVQDALDEHDTPRARELLARYGERLRTSDLRGYLDYLSAAILVHEGRSREAEPVVRWIDGWLGHGDRAPTELDDYGHLPSLNRWLMGRIHLAEDRPQDALAAFEAALQGSPTPALRVAAAVGRGLALGALNRHDAARAAFRETLDQFAALPERRRQAREGFETALLDLHEQQWQAQDYANALAYLEMAAELAAADDAQRAGELRERLGYAARDAANDTADAQTRRNLRELAGRSLEYAADAARMAEPRYGTLLWDAAEQYDEAGRLVELRRVLARFVPGRDKHPRMPRALLMLGQAWEGEDLAQALGWYQRVIAEYPRLKEAAQAKVLSARALLSLGATRLPEAEQILTDLLVDDYVSPDADEYREALLTLCELLYQQGRYAEAIGRLEDFDRLYPEDPQRYRSRFMLANAHRRSAYALRDEPPAGVPDAALAVEVRTRFEHAAHLYDQLLEDLERAGVTGLAADAYARLGLFYRGDCLFELNTPESLQAALATYRNAAARYEGTPAALTAHVQIANIHLRLGDVAEAARALARARWLLRTVPPEVFTTAPSGDAADWERFLATALSSELFHAVSMAAQ